MSFLGSLGKAATFGLSGLLLPKHGNPHTSVDGQFKDAMNTASTNATGDRNRYLDIMSGGQGALNTSIQSAVNSAMPGFNHQMESTRESAVRRGMSTGDLGTSYEGDLSSAFQKNIANAAGSQAMNMFNTQANGAGNLYQSDNNNYLDLLSGQRDYETAQQNAKRQRNAALFGGLGAAVGGAFGGPAGASVGSAIGSGVGGY